MNGILVDNVISKIVEFLIESFDFLEGVNREVSMVFGVGVLFLETGCNS